MSGTIAIVGASSDRKKYGNKAVRAFHAGGWTVFPINPRLTDVEGIPAYSSVADIPGTVDRVSMYVPPSVGRAMLPDIAAKMPTELFLNPGSDDPALIEDAKALGLQPIQACSIVNIGLRPDMFPDE